MSLKFDLEVQIVNSTIVVKNATPAPNVLDMEYWDIVAAGSPRSVAEELKRRFVGPRQGQAR